MNDSDGNLYTLTDEELQTAEANCREAESSDNSDVQVTDHDKHLAQFVGRIRLEMHLKACEHILGACGKIESVKDDLCALQEEGPKEIQKAVGDIVAELNGIQVYLDFLWRKDEPEGFDFVDQSSINARYERNRDRIKELMRKELEPDQTE